MRRLGCLFFAVIVTSHAAAAEKQFCTTSKYVVPIVGVCAPDYACEGNKLVVGECFDVHGRISISASFREELWVIGTKHILSLDYPDSYPDLGNPKRVGPDPRVGITILPLPARVANLLDDGTSVYGDYRVCPLEPFVQGEPQSACVESGKRMVAKRTHCRGCDERTPLPSSAFKGIVE